jgi:hypothetical protein
MANGQEVAAVDTPSEAELSALAAEYYEAVQGDVHKDRYCHWQIV